MSKQRTFRWASNALLVVFAVVLTFLVVELIVRNSDISTGTGAGNSAKKWLDKHWKPINRFGFRDFEISDIPRDKEYVLFVGDSFTAGQGVNFNETFYYNVRKALPSNLHAINIGVCGYSTVKEEVLYSKFRADTNIKPGVVVHQYFVNDIEDYIDPIPLPHVSELMRIVTSYSDVVDLFYTYLGLKSFGEKYVEALASAYNSEKILAKHLGDINRFHNTVRNDGSKVYFILFPFLGSDSLTQGSSSFLDKVESNFLKNCSPGDVLVNTTGLALSLPQGQRVAGMFDAHPSFELHQLVASEIIRMLAIDGDRKNMNGNVASSCECEAKKVTRQ